MSKPKLTPWFPGHVKPARTGVYERARSFFDDRVYSKWDGHIWMAYQFTKEAAAQTSGPSSFQSLQWRGLAEKP